MMTARAALALAACALAAIASFASAHAQARPSQRVVVDEAHSNLFAKDAEHYRQFIRTVADDGFAVDVNRLKFSRERLGNVDVLVIAGANGAPPSAPIEERAAPAFSTDEVDAIERWLTSGGSLLLVTDVDPTGLATQVLGDRLGITMSGNWIDDPRFRVPASASVDYPGWLVFARESGLLADHPITRGLGAGEFVNRVMSVGGGSLTGPPGSISLLTLSPTAVNLLPPRFPNVFPNVPRPSGPAGQSQGLAFEFRQGRVVALADMALLTGTLDMKGFDNRTFAANILRWLALAM